jgi:hypothetical protein
MTTAGMTFERDEKSAPSSPDRSHPLDPTAFLNIRERGRKTTDKRRLIVTFQKGVEYPGVEDRTGQRPKPSTRSWAFLDSGEGGRHQTLLSSSPFWRTPRWCV